MTLSTSLEWQPLAAGGVCVVSDALSGCRGVCLVLLVFIGYLPNGWAASDSVWWALLVSLGACWASIAIWVAYRGVWWAVLVSAGVLDI